MNPDTIDNNDIERTESTRSAHLKVMKTFLISFCLLAFTACSKNSETEKFEPTQSIVWNTMQFEHAWIMSWKGYMTVVVALTENEYFHWVYSDVQMEDEPTFPIRGSYLLTPDQLELKGEGFHYSTIWTRITDEKGRDCLIAPSDNDDPSRTLYPFLENFNPENPLKLKGDS